MKKLFLILLLLFISSAYSQDDKDFKKGIDFIGRGTEPFWSVKIDIEKSITFKLENDDLHFKTGMPGFTPVHSNNGGAEITGESKKYNIVININKDSCNDGMSDIIYPYSVKISITQKGKTEPIEFTGCGNYTYDYRLDNIWTLVKFKGGEIKKGQYSKTKPYIEIKIKDSRIGGNTGCNGFFCPVEIRGNKIVISTDFTMTKMACDDMGFESDFVQAISGKTYKYKTDGLKLYLIEDETVIMEFRKTD